MNRRKGEKVTKAKREVNERYLPTFKPMYLERKEKLASHGYLPPVVLIVNLDRCIMCRTVHRVRGQGTDQPYVFVLQTSQGS